MNFKTNNFKQKSIKQVISIILMVLLTTTVTFEQGIASAAVISGEGIQEEYTKVYFDNTNAKWSSVNAYIWTPGSVSATCVPMTLVNGETNIYEYDVPVKCQKIIFKNTVGTTSWNIQSSDLSVSTGSLNCYKPSNSSNKSSGQWIKYEEPIKELTLSTITSDKKSPQQIGASVEFTANAKNIQGDAIYEYKVNGEKVTSDGAKLVWTPSKIGVYEIQATVTDGTGKSSSKVVTYTIKDISQNKTTIFYKGYSNAYIHYKVGNGAWTSAPGVKMDTSNELEGYTHKIVIDLNDADSLIACFNNGSGSWDSNNGKDYTFKSGTYTFSSGTIKEIEEPVKEISIKNFESSFSSPQLLGTDVLLSADIEGGNGNVVYKFTEVNNDEEKVIYEGSNNKTVWTPNKAGNYTLIVSAKDAKNKTAEKTIDYVINDKLYLDSFECINGKRVALSDDTTFNAKVSGGIGRVAYTFTDEDGNVLQEGESSTLTTKFSKIGDNTITVTVKDESGTTETKSVTITVYEGFNYGNFNVSSEYGGVQRVFNTTIAGVDEITGGVGELTYKSYITSKSTGKVYGMCNDKKTSYKFNNKNLAGEYTFTVEVTDKEGTTESKSYDFTLYPRLTSKVVAEPTINKSDNTVPLNSKIKIKLNLENAVNKVYITFMDKDKNVLQEGYDDSYIFDTNELGKTSITVTYQEEGDKFSSCTGITIDAIDQEFSLDETIFSDYLNFGADFYFAPRARGNGAPYTYNSTIYNSDNEVVYTNKQTCQDCCEQRFIPDKVGDYRLVIEATNLQGKTLTREYKFVVYDLKLLDYGTKQSSPQGVGTPIELFVKAQCLGSDNGGCEFTVYDSNNNSICDETIHLKDGYGSINWIPQEKGTYTIEYRVFNYGCAERRKLTFEVGDPVKALLDHFDVSASDVKVGQAVKFDALAKGEGLSFNYDISVLDEENNEVFNSTSNLGTWTPDKVGNYTINLKVVASNGQELSDSKKVSVSDASKNTTTIYYNGYSNPYIHYRVGNGAWTNAPGVKMEATNEMAGYTHKIVINAADSNKVTACFNNGSGSWDSNGGRNYSFGLGQYTLSNGIITDITPREFELSSFTASKSSISLGNSVTLNALAQYGAGDYKYKFTSIKDGVETIINDYSSNASVNFKPDEIGNYILKVYAKDADGKILEKTTPVGVTEISKNIVTIYYKGYSNPNIHYRVGNGAWTNAPGIKMETTNELSGYAYKVTIDLKDSDNLTVCFNNGYGSWDSNGGKNYTFKAGTYTFNSGVITEINK